MNGVTVILPWRKTQPRVGRDCLTILDLHLAPPCE